MNFKLVICVVASMLGLSGCSIHESTSGSTMGPSGNSSNGLPSKRISIGKMHPEIRPNHIVIVIEENHSYSEIAGNPQAPYINELMHNGANFTNYHGVEHPSEPNYLSLFSGQDQGVTDDSCPHTFTGPNLASELHGAGLTFGGYSEDLPSVGFIGCSNSAMWYFHGTYARKHNPWVNFTNVPVQENMPFTAFPKDFNQLPTVSFVIPNLEHDMHNGSIRNADAWLKQNIGSYREWSKTHDSLLIVTWDEDDNSVGNHVPAILVGPMILSGMYAENVNHFHLLRTIEELYGLAYLGNSSGVVPLQGIWR